MVIRNRESSVVRVFGVLAFPGDFEVDLGAWIEV